MNPQIKNKIIRLTNDLKDLSDLRCKHFSFILNKNKIVSIGWNLKKTHPKAKIYQYRYDCIHSELSALIKFNGNKNHLKDFVLVNIRVNSDGYIRQSKPCSKCLPWLETIGFKAIWYTNEEA